MKILPEKFSADRQTVCVQGLGFVGAAMSLAVADAKDCHGVPLYNVIGIDIPNEAGHRKSLSINEGKFPFENNDPRLDTVQKEAYENGNLWATTDPEYFSCADIIVVDINLDVKYTEADEPVLDLKLFEEAMHTLGQHMKAAALLIVETTVPPGTCERIVYPIIKEEFLKRGIPDEEIFIAHSYERVMPGKDYFNSIVNFWRVYSGINEISADKCQTFLESIINTEKYPLTRLERPAATETAKVLENSYRAATIAFIDEWGRFAEAIGIDLFEVIDAIRIRPTHSNMRQPGFGVGGYCLTKDPYFAPLAAREIWQLKDLEFPFSTTAVRINNAMPLVSLDKIEKMLGGNLAEKKILVMGVSYRQDVGDTRYSPTEIFVKEARIRGAVVTCQDPLVSYWIEMDMNIIQTVPDLVEYDAVIFTVQHRQYMEIDFEKIKSNKNILIFDANCVLGKHQRNAIIRSENLNFSCIGRGGRI